MNQEAIERRKMLSLFQKCAECKGKVINFGEDFITFIFKKIFYTRMFLMSNNLSYEDYIKDDTNKISVRVSSYIKKEN